MFSFKRKNKQPKTEEQIQKEQTKSIRKEANQMMLMARGFEASLVDKAQKSELIWKRLGIGALVISGLSVAAVSGLTPLKEAVPFVIKVDNATGTTNVVTTIKNKQMTYDEVTNRHWVYQYVLFRESYNWNNIQAFYDTTKLFNGPDVQAKYKAFYESPSAPHKILKQNYEVLVKVTNISFVGDLAQVRFEKRLVPAGNSEIKPSPPQKMIATIGFEFKSTPMTQAVRDINPLGFQVLSYNVTEEVAP
ncbi:virB8 family protein [Neisseria sp.]|uniref:virB8 family protein n=1 Tax=Neisseria sp. TaxID=192066 RepID=UPI00359FC30D